MNSIKGTKENEKKEQSGERKLILLFVKMNIGLFVRLLKLTLGELVGMARHP